MKINMMFLTILSVFFLFCGKVANTQEFSKDLNTVNNTTQAFNVNCTLRFEDEKSDKKKLDSKLKVLEIIIKYMNGTDQTLSEKFKKSELFKPSEWMRVSGKYGEGILQLKPNYEILSLQSLTIQKEEIKLKITESTPGCMSQLSATEYEDKMRKFLLKYISKERHEEICNMHIKDNSGKAVFEYECCVLDSDNEMKCHRVRKNDWVHLIDILTYICIILAIMYFPTLIPESVYSESGPPTAFVHVLKKPFTVFVNKEKKFFKNVKTVGQTGGESEHTFEKLCLKIESDQLVSENSSPINFTRMLYDAIKPKDNYNVPTKEGKSNQNFLKANILGPITFCGMQLKWGTCVYYSSLLILSGFIVSPWIFRMVVYYLYEKDIRLRRYTAAADRNLKESFGVNLTYFFGPVHVLFLICYALLLIDFILFNMFRKEVRHMFEKTIVSSLVNMHSISKKNVLQCAAHILLLPLTKCGISGVIFWIPLLPLVILMVIFLVFPALSLGSTLLWKFLRYIFPEINNKTENRLIKIFEMDKVLHKHTASSSGTNSKSRDLPAKDMGYKNITPSMTEVVLHTNTVPVSATSTLIWWGRFQQQSKLVCERIVRILLVLMAMTTAISCVLLMAECIIFMFEVAVYTLIGLVLNSSHAVQYLTAGTLMWVYFYDCFYGISTKYMNFNKAIHKILLSENKDEVLQVAEASSDSQENTAFKVCHACDKEPELEIHSGTPKWSTRGVVLLMDKYDQLFMTKRFFFKASTLDHPYCPGELFENVMSSLGRFTCILIFLLFVTLVVLAFGDTYEISISNQLLATCAGGIVPLLIQRSKVLFSKQKDPDSEQLQQNISFMTKFYNLIESSIEFWNVENEQFLQGLQFDNNNSRECGNNFSVDMKSNHETIVMPSKSIKNVTSADINIQITYM